jgi:hypothetical protein
MVRYFTDNEAVCSIDAQTGTVRIVSAGTCEISAQVEATDDHDSVTTSSNIQITVSKAKLNITASSATVENDPALYKVVPSFSDFQYGENQSVLTEQPICTSDYFTRVGTFDDDRKVLTYKTTCSGARANNYEITYISGVLTHIRRDD